VSRAAVVLAAGAGSRFDGATHKLLTPFRGRPLVAWAVSAAVDAGVGEVAVVVGGCDLGAVLPGDVAVVDNPRWEEGQATSLQAAVRWAEGRGHEAIVVGLGDQPLVPPEAWRAVADAPAAPVAVATYEGRRRLPVRLHRDVWPLLPAAGDEGARVLMRGRPDLVSEVPCLGNPADIDTVEDLQRRS
jgi:CTP:molybdopterin cytidylyltransferase MocA